MAKNEDPLRNQVRQYIDTRRKQNLRLLMAMPGIMTDTSRGMSGIDAGRKWLPPAQPAMSHADYIQEKARIMDAMAGMQQARAKINAGVASGSNSDPAMFKHFLDMITALGGKEIQARADLAQEWSRAMPKMAQDLYQIHRDQTIFTALTDKGLVDSRKVDDLARQLANLIVPAGDNIAAAGDVVNLVAQASPHEVPALNARVSELLGVPGALQMVAEDAVGHAEGNRLTALIKRGYDAAEQYKVDSDASAEKLFGEGTAFEKYLNGDIPGVGANVRGLVRKVREGLKEVGVDVKDLLGGQVNPDDLDKMLKRAWDIPEGANPDQHYADLLEALDQGQELPPTLRSMKAQIMGSEEFKGFQERYNIPNPDLAFRELVHEARKARQNERRESWESIRKKRAGEVEDATPEYHAPSESSDLVGEGPGDAEKPAPQDDRVHVTMRGDGAILVYHNGQKLEFEDADAFGAWEDENIPDLPEDKFVEHDDEKAFDLVSSGAILTHEGKPVWDPVPVSAPVETRVLVSDQPDPTTPQDQSPTPTLTQDEPAETKPHPVWDPVPKPAPPPAPTMHFDEVELSAPAPVRDETKDQAVFQGKPVDKNRMARKLLRDAARGV